MSPWHETNPDLYREVRRLVETQLDTWRVVLDHSKVFVRGSMLLQDQGGVEIDRFDVEVELPDDYPNGLPKVRETGGKLPKTKDRHFLPDDTACLFVPDEQWRHYPEGTSIVDFIERPVRQFFLNQASVNVIGKAILGERSHGEDGRVEYYFEELGTKNPRAVIDFLRLLHRKTIKGSYVCYCGSGRSFRQCNKTHWAKLSRMHGKVEPRQVAKLIQEIESCLAKLGPGSGLQEGST